MAKFAIRDERGFNQVFAPVGSTPLRSRRRGDWFVAMAQKNNARRILELGCGTGENASHVAAAINAEVVAVDISDAFLESAQARYAAPNIQFVKFDLLGPNSLSLGRFDLVIGNGILHHLVRHLDGVLKALHEISNPSGTLAFIEPNFLNPYCAFIFGTQVGRRFANFDPDEMAFTPAQLHSALSQAGWKQVDVTTRDFLLPGIPQSFVRPVLAVEPALESSRLTRWLAQSHFVSAKA